jgi:hypothetical protein
MFYSIVTCIPIATQRLGKHISAQANFRNSKTSIAMQWYGKHASAVDVVFCGVRAKWL